MSVASTSSVSPVSVSRPYNLPELTYILPKHMGHSELLKCANALSISLKEGNTLEIDCGRKGIMLGKRALTHTDERVTADMLKGGQLLDSISKKA